MNENKNKNIIQETFKQLDELAKTHFELQISSLISKLNEMNNDSKFCYHYTDGEISFYKTDDNYDKLEFIAKISYHDVSILREILNLLNVKPTERSLRGMMNDTLRNDVCDLDIMTLYPHPTTPYTP